MKQDTLDKSRAVLKGKIGEQMAPVLPEFRYNPADARFLGSPIDYIIFDGYSEAKEGRGKIRRIVLMDVKTGNARLSPIEKKVRDAVAAGSIEWETLELKG
ncbi:MAG TPA: Holliday junction resolvase-like protein [Methanotrichaceae archaeon]|nr:Holliday junction resolvase-like protein [Methanotrichaceae archaeon]